MLSCWHGLQLNEYAVRRTNSPDTASTLTCGHQCQSNICRQLALQLLLDLVACTHQLDPSGHYDDCS